MKNSDNFFDEVNYRQIVDNIKNIYMSDGSMSVLLDFERVLSHIDMYAFENWRLGELVSGPRIDDYYVACIFMWPYSRMPNPAFIERCQNKNIQVTIIKKKIKVPVKVEGYDDFQPGTHYPRMTHKLVWLVQIIVPRDQMAEIRNASVDLAGQKIDLSDLEDSYIKDLDEDQYKSKEQDQQNAAMPLGPAPMGGPLGGPPGMPPPLGGPMI